MTDRRTASTINDTELDQLYERAERAEQEADATALAAAHLTDLARQRAERAEAAIARVRALHVNGYGLCDECTGSHGVPWPCPTIRTLDQPAPAAAPQATDHTDQLTAALREALSRLYAITRTGDPTPIGYQAVHPIHPHDYDRWRAALNPNAPSPTADHS